VEHEFKKLYATLRGQFGFSLNVFLLSVEWNTLERRINIALCLITCEVTL
jgi:hypothetical protein